MARKALAAAFPDKLTYLGKLPASRAFSASQGRSAINMLPQSEFDSPMLANAPAPVAIAAITQDRALIGLLRSVVDPSTDVILVTSEAGAGPAPEQPPGFGGVARQHVHRRRSRRARPNACARPGPTSYWSWSEPPRNSRRSPARSPRVSFTASCIDPVSAPRVRLFVEAALRRHEVENVERTLEQVRPDFSRIESPKSAGSAGRRSGKRAAGLRWAGARRNHRGRVVPVRRAASRPMARRPPPR